MVSKKGLKSKIGLVDMLMEPIGNQLILSVTIFLWRLIFEDLRYFHHKIHKFDMMEDIIPFLPSTNDTFFTKNSDLLNIS